MADRTARRMALAAIGVAALSLIPLVLGSDSNYSTMTGDADRGSGALGLSAATTTDFLGLSWQPTSLTLMNDGDDAVWVNYSWRKKGGTFTTTSVPVPAKTAVPIGGAKIDSAWVGNHGSNTAADTLFWIAER